MENQILNKWAAMDESGERVIRLFNTETQSDAMGQILPK